MAAGADHGDAAPTGRRKRVHRKATGDCADPRLQETHGARNLQGWQPSRRPPLLFVHGSFCGGWVWAEHFLPFFREAGVAVRRRVAARPRQKRRPKAARHLRPRRLRRRRRRGGGRIRPPAGGDRPFDGRIVAQRFVQSAQGCGTRAARAREPLGPRRLPDGHVARPPGPAARAEPRPDQRHGAGGLRRDPPGAFLARTFRPISRSATCRCSSANRCAPTWS